MNHLCSATQPFKIVSLDAIQDFDQLRSAKKSLHLLLDHSTAYSFMVTSKIQSAPDSVKLINNISQFGGSHMPLTDQYPGINSKGFKDFLKDNNGIYSSYCTVLKWP